MSLMVLRVHPVHLLVQCPLWQLGNVKQGFMNVTGIPFMSFIGMCFFIVSEVFMSPANPNPLAFLHD